MPIPEDEILERVELLKTKIETQKIRLVQFKERTLTISEIKVDQIIAINQELTDLIKETDESSYPDIQSVIETLKQNTENTYVEIIAEKIAFYTDHVERQKNKLQEYKNDTTNIHLLALDAIKNIYKDLLLLSDRVYESELLDNFKVAIQKLQTDVKKIYSSFISAQMKHQELEINRQENLLNNYSAGKGNLSTLKLTDLEKIIITLKNLNDDVVEYNFLNRFHRSVPNLHDKAIDVYERMGHILSLKHMRLKISNCRALLKNKDVNLDRMERKLISLNNKIEENIFLSTKNKEIFEIIINKLLNTVYEKKQLNSQSSTRLSIT